MRWNLYFVVELVVAFVLGFVVGTVVEFVNFAGREHGWLLDKFVLRVGLLVLSRKPWDIEPVRLSTRFLHR